MTRAVFAIPGDKDRRTGGFIYEARVLKELNEIGFPTRHLQLPDSFPDPSEEDMAVTLDMLKAIPDTQPIILDGLVFGAIDPAGLAQIQAPVIAMIHHPLGLETGLAPKRAAFLKRNEAAALRHVAHVIVPSPETARVLCAEFGAHPQTITVASPGFNRPCVTHRPLDPPLILSVGLLAPRKGHDVLIAALAQIKDLPWQAEIVGKTHDERYAAELHRQTDQLAIADRITFSGELQQDRLTERFNAASVFALATRYEGYGMVLSEAILFNLPVVTCSVGAVPTTVGDAALVVPPDDPNAFSQALRSVLGDPVKASNLRQRAKNKAALLPHWRDTANVFSSVIAGIQND